MKKILAILLPILILTVTLVLFAFPSSAATEEAGYAVWSSEEDYLANPHRPDATYSTQYLTTSNVAGKGYVLCYGDIFVSSQVQLDRKQNIVIDLNGYTMTASSKIIINGTSAPSWLDRASLTIKNGSLIHEKNQFIQPRPNSEIYLENLKITEKSNNNFIYDASLRILHFKNCTFEIAPECTSGAVISLSAAYDCTNADRLLPREADGTYPDYERNIIFEDSRFIDNSTKSYNFIYIRDAGVRDQVNVCFTDGAGFDKEIGDNFIVCENDRVEYAKFVVAKGARFKEQSIPFDATNFGITFYDKVEVYGENGNFVSFGRETDLVAKIEDQYPLDPELTWGKSGDDAYPHQLCLFHCTVTWDTGIEGVDPITVEGYADGLRISYPVDTSAPAYGDDGKLYMRTHEGWSLNEDGSDWQKEVIISEKEVTYYAAYSGVAIAVAEFSSSDASVDNIISMSLSNQVSNQTFREFSDNSYVKFFTDVYYVSDDTAVIGSEGVSKTLTVDLGGNTLYKDFVSTPGSGAFELVNGTLNIVNGTVSSSRTSLAIVNGQSTLNISDDVVLLYNTAPLLKMNGGTVNLNGCKLSQGSTDDVPTILYTGSEGDAAVNVNACEINASGALASYLPSSEGEGLNMILNVTDCECIVANSLFSLSRIVADRVPAGSALSFNMTNSGAKTPVVFDVAGRSDGSIALDGVYSIGAGCYLDAVPALEFGTLALPDSMRALKIVHPIFGYVVGESDFTMKFNLTLEAGFTANFYVPVRSDLAYFESYLGRVESSSFVTAEIDGVSYYVFSVEGISAANSLDKIPVSFGFTDADGDYAIGVNYDPISYFKDLLSDEDILVRKLAASALTYIKAAYEYSSTYVSAEVLEIFESEEYLSNVRPGADVIGRDDVDRGNIAIAFTGAQLYLSDDVSLRLNLRGDFTGTLSVMDSVYNVTDGKVGECTYIEVPLGAVSLYMDEIVITGEKNDGTIISGEYSLTSYVNAMKDSDELLSSLLDSLFAYCYEAYVTYNGGVLPPYIDHTPPIDAELR